MGGPVIRDPTPAWLKPENASVFDSYWTRIARLLGRAIGADDPASQVLALATPTDVPGGRTLSDFAKGIKAYHGSPHDFEQFSLAKIGTGEGAQAYGHGLYFAEKPEVAKQYRDALKWRGSNWDDPAVIAGNVLETNGGDRAAAIKQLEEANRRNVGFKASELGNQKRQQAIDLLSQGESISHAANPGRMYEVHIKADPEQFLDWDKPLREQSPAIRQAMRDAMGDVRPVRLKDGSYSVTVVSPGGEGRMISSVQADTPTGALEAFSRYVDEAPGGQVYSEVAAARNFTAAGRGREAAAQRTASEHLATTGVPGIKYLDQMSRAAGEGSRNYVVFDDKLISIVKKYGIAGAVGAGLINQAQAAQLKAQGYQ